VKVLSASALLDWQVRALRKFSLTTTAMIGLLRYLAGTSPILFTCDEAAQVRGGIVMTEEEWQLPHC